jgi:hypothetical protein
MAEYNPDESKSADETSEQFQVPVRQIFNIFDVNKWYKSEVGFMASLKYQTCLFQAYSDFLNFIKRLSRSVRSLPTTSHVEIGQYPQKLLDFLDTLEVGNFN